MTTIIKFDIADPNLVSAWERIQKENPVHDLGQTYCWNKVWWDYYSNTIATKELHLLAEKDEENIITIWPLMLRKRNALKKIHWIGQVDGMYTDYCGALFSKDPYESTLKMLEYFHSEKSAWDLIEIRIPHWNSQFQTLLNCLIINKQKLQFSWKSSICDYSSYISSSDSFENFINSIRKSTKKNIKYYLRKLNTLNYKFEILRGNEIKNGLQDLIKLNNLNWDILSDVKNQRFHKSLFDCVDEHESNIIIPRLEINGEAVATFIGYESNNRFFIHTAGIRREYVEGISPGSTLYALVIQYTITNNKILDFSPGLEEYKLRFGAIVEPLYNLQIWHNSSRRPLFKLLEIAKLYKSL